MVGSMPISAASPDYHLHPLWHVDGMKPGDKAFVDIQNDVTLDDIGLAMREADFSDNVFGLVEFSSEEIDGGPDQDSAAVELIYSF